MDRKCVLQWKRLHPDAVAPTRGSKEAAGLDLSSVQNCTIPPFSRKIVGTGIQISLPSSTYGMISPRSSWAARGIQIGGGCIDKDYTGEVKVILLNMSDKDVEIAKGDRIAQLIVPLIEYPEVEEVKKIDKKTERGTGAFGSTN